MKLHINTVVINGLDYTKKFIESIQTKHDYKLRIIDAGSEDGTQEWCREQGIDCWRRPNNLSANWNFAIEEALKDPECQYIFIPNNDVVFHKDTIDNLIEALEESEFVMVTGNNVAPTHSVEAMKAIEVKDDKSTDYARIKDWREEGPDFSCFMIKRDFVEKIGWFDENFTPAYFEDNDMHYRIQLAGYHAKRISRSPYYHYGSTTVRINPKLGLGSHRTAGVFQQKWNATPSACMDGKGWKHPYNDTSKDHKFWKGQNEDRM